jgi:hypothetical protein
MGEEWWDGGGEYAEGWYESIKVSIHKISKNEARQASCGMESNS